MRTFSIGSSGQDFHFEIDDRGWVSAVARPDGSTPVIGGQFDLDHEVAVPDNWSAQHEATGNNRQIADGQQFYPGAGFDTSLVAGQVDDVLWALRNAKVTASGRLLELGCGPGFLLQALGAALPGWAMTGIDPATTSVAQARARGLEVYDGFIDTAVVAGTFHAFVVMGNFQLHPDPSATLTNLAAIAEPGAELYLDLKNPRSLPRRLARLAVSTPGVRASKRVQAFAAHAWHGLRHGVPKSAALTMLSETGWVVTDVRTVAPRLLRFNNEHGLAHGAKGHAWQVLDQVDGLFDERAWIQIRAYRE